VSRNWFNSERAPTILVIGKNGQVGWELQRALLSVGDIIAVDRNRIDLSDPDNVKLVISEIQPDIIVNAAAYTAVDKAEEEHELAYLINAIAPKAIAEEAKRINALLIHYSTDYVFNGHKESPYNESDTPDPINVYGASKLAGEQAIQKSGCQYLILRTSWVFSSRTHNFLLSMLRLAKERPELKIVADQYGSPTSARFIADTTAQIISQANRELKQDRFTSGIYNLVSSGSTSWHGFASAIIESAQKTLPDVDLVTTLVQAIATTEYPTPAKRPVNSRLSTKALADRFGIDPTDWHEQMRQCLVELKEPKSKN